ncbi:uncharacterized protein [Epargyreus clarus]|uniref:uncharacterized protein isoform X2 n=1 Tax=Epargyreus clarus TaxID=520877 RepID=UPI003C2B5A71
MKTSTSQFEAMVGFMERHGDLNKLADGPEGRVRLVQQWDTLTSMLNLDATGEARDRERWKRHPTSAYEADVDFSIPSSSHQEASGSSHMQSMEMIIPDLTTPSITPPNVNPEPVRLPTPNPRPKMESPESRESRRRHLYSRGPVTRQRRPLPNAPQRRRVSQIEQASRADDMSAQFADMDERWRILTREIASEHIQLRERELEERRAEREERQADREQHRAEMIEWRTIATDYIRQRERERQAEQELLRTEIARWQTLVGQLVEMINKKNN